jgi:pyruvate/2-oxoglutarate dehydrogenase complex dihydrolipoamide dehydrogenase (E3) component
MKTADFIIIGGGGAGLTAAFTANGFGKKVILIEKDKVGGECTWNGCVPSKALIKSSKIAHSIQIAHKYGIETTNTFDPKNVMNHVRWIQNKVYTHETPEVLAEKGIEVIIGKAAFVSKDTVKVNDLTIKGKKIIIATGSKPMIPKIKGLDSVDYLTNETIFKLDQPPKSLGIVGAGPIGIELAQSFNRLGTEVHVFLRDDKILKKENESIASLVKETLSKEGVIFHDHFSMTHVSGQNDGILINDELTVKELLIATGRQVDYSALNLPLATIELNEKGTIKTDHYLRTTNKNIYCCGDVIGPFRLSHMAYEQGKAAAMNAILPINQKIAYKHIVWGVFTDPEVAHLGVKSDYDPSKTITFELDFKSNDRSITDLETEGLMIIITDHHYKILEVNCLGPRAGELIHHFQLLKTLDIPLYKAESLIYAYPTYSEVLREAGKRAKLHRINNNFFVKIYRRFTQ